MYHLSDDDIKREILLFLKHNQGHSFNYKQISFAIEMQGKENKERVRDLLEELRKEKLVIQTAEGKFTSAVKDEKHITGTIEFLNMYKARVIDEKSSQEIFIKTEDAGTALHGDMVKVRRLKNKGGSIYGEVIQVLNRSKKEFTGLFVRNKNVCFVIPDHPRIYVDFYIPSGKTGKAKDGDKVLIEFLEWDEGDPNPVACVREVFGRPGDHKAEMNAIMAEFGLKAEFEDDVQYFARRIPDRISEQELKGRMDFRPYLTFTIDPEDAKDFDDALSYRITEDGLEEVGIHIADVSHYVQPDNALDREAFRRGTSVYLVDRCIPMLPERLSNNICSLNPNVDRLCFSVVVYFDRKGNIVKHLFSKTVIHSKRRFTYEEVQDILENKRQDPIFGDVLKRLDVLAKKLRKEREVFGSLFFNKEEVKFRLDEKGKPVEVYFKTQKDAHKLIEDFMLLANRKVAEFLGKIPENRPSNLRAEDYWCVYRIHDVPSEEKLIQLKNFVSKFGIRLHLGLGTDISKSLNKMLEEVKHRKEKNMIELLTIRSMPKAIYTTVHEGHYGLGFDYYCHFTSPIRRYPDLMVHRLLHARLEGKPFPPRSMYEEYAKHCSEREKNAAEAERASIRYKQVEYMAERIGQVFDGMISGVTEWGIYVELKENKCEGMIRKKDLPNDYYVFDEDNLRYVGRKTRKVYSLGDDITVMVMNADVRDRKIDLIPVEAAEALMKDTGKKREKNKKKKNKKKKK
ncbi:MAG: ribonuclease R [Bacteroidia bacterium]|nr:ribonuclease R [Bacteroidia bacterium]